ncbi:MAG: GNAT family N-acetyltransferase [Spirochaetales bacterium]|nr:GNAT family N-acetyltransferase [Spirochaetales bacterium]
MKFRFEPINYSEVLEIESWRYNGFEKAIYMDRYHESRERGDNPLKGPMGCVGYSVYNDSNILFGLMEYYFQDDGVYLGLAINPIYIGRGLSTAFITSGIDFLNEEYKGHKKVKIEVHRKNIQGIKAYEKCGFKFKQREDDILLYMEE